MDPKDAAEEAEFQAIKWKPNDKGAPGRRMPADYIMRHDRDAQRTYLEMRTIWGSPTKRLSCGSSAASMPSFARCCFTRRRTTASTMRR